MNNQEEVLGLDKSAPKRLISLQKEANNNSVLKVTPTLKYDCQEFGPSCQLGPGMRACVSSYNDICKGHVLERGYLERLQLDMP